MAGRYTVDDFHTVILELNGDSDYEEPGFLEQEARVMVVNYEKAKQAKEFIEGFLVSKDDQKKLDQWKQANKEKEVEKNTFRF